MKFARQNLMDLARSVGSEPGEAPISIIDVPADLQSIVELCRPIPALLGTPNTTTLHETSQISGNSQAVAAGGGSSSTNFLRLAAGIWRLNMRLRSMTTGAANASVDPMNACSLGIQEPSEANLWLLLTHAGNQAVNVVQYSTADYYFHFPLGCVLTHTTVDPVTALATSRSVAGVYACKIL